MATIESGEPNNWQIDKKKGQIILKLRLDQIE